MKELQQILKQEGLKSLFKEARYGLEKESQRVYLDGALAMSDHPSILGNRSFHPSIQTDFSETQVEMITPVADTPCDVLNYLAAIHEVVLRSLPEDEMLWPLSMPPILPRDDTKIMIAKLERFEEILYRRFLAHSYGKRKQMVSGIHYNFEYSPLLLKKMYEAQTEITCYERFKSEIYLKASRNYLHHRWLITYLMGASPISEEGYFTETDRQIATEPVRSIRNSEFGYTNHDDVFVSYRSIEDYVMGIKYLVDLGIISEEKEFYSAVRLRGGETVADLQSHGVDYIEVRNIDINPFATYGITEEQIELLHLFLMYMLWMDNDEEDLDELIYQGDRLNNQVALEHPLAKTALYQTGTEIVNGMLAMAEALNLTDGQRDLIQSIQTLLDHPAQTLAGRMFSAKATNHELSVTLGRDYREKAHKRPYQLAGFTDMELSTQIMMFDAIQKGVSVEVIDRHDQIIKLKHGKQMEYVKNANMTSHDSYIVPLLMGNKTVTKKLLAEKGFRVPTGKEFASLEEAIANFDYFVGKGIVVKPKSTNYGIGISIFKEGASQENYIEALNIAFREDTEVLVEEFLAGTEYRFFVINNRVKAIMLRVPANVKGDGVRSIRELVAKKNLDPLRGTQHRSPLERIQLGELEQLMLKEQGYHVDDVLPLDEIVYLRENSNISTGGDSIDVTDEFDASYKQIAVEAVAVLGAKVSGIDLIIPDNSIPATRDSETYGIIEANFNPAMHMHSYPFSGTGRRVTKDVLAMLFPELA